MGIIGCAFFPHPPLAVPQVGRGQEQAAAETLMGMEQLAALVADMKPDVIAVVSPHGAAFSDVIAVRGDDRLSGTLEQFRAPDVQVDKPVNAALAQAFVRQAEQASAPVALVDAAMLRRLKADIALDHGAIVPLTFIEKRYADYELLHITPGSQSLRKQFQAGQALRRAAEESDLRVLVLASGDMSHRLKADGPYGYDANGPVFDGLMSGAMERNAPGELLAIDPAVARGAGECGWRSFALALGALEGDAVNSRLISYEGPFGVGYMTALITPGAQGETSRIGHLDRAERARAAAAREGEDGFVRVARAGLEHFVRTGTRPDWQGISREVCEIERARMEKHKAGTFVSLHIDGELRGCMGTIVPVCAHVGEEILHNAVAACSEDPRFPSVEEAELLSLEVKVDVLSPFQPVASPADLDPQRYGVIVEKDGHRGLLLPRLDGVASVQQQLDIACRKAGFRWQDGMGIKLFRFTVERHGGQD